jgi:hypothetical protein
MDEYQLEQASEVLAQLQELNSVSESVADAIELAARKLDLCQTLFSRNDDVVQADEEEPTPSEIAYSIWWGVVEAAQLLINHAEEETGARPGCLPLDPKGCELMGLAFAFRRVVMENFGLYGTKFGR